MYHFTFTGKEERQATVTIRNGTVQVQDGIIYVALTDQGAKTLADLDEPLLALHRKLMSHLSQGDLKDLMRLLEKLREPWTTDD